jgi:hypothetical protein
MRRNAAIVKKHLSTSVEFWRFVPDASADMNSVCVRYGIGAAASSMTSWIDGAPRLA